MVGWTWMQKSGYSLRKPEATFSARAQASNKPQVELFLNTYKDIDENNNIPP